MNSRTIGLVALLMSSCAGPQQSAPPLAPPKEAMRAPPPPPAPVAEIRGELLGTVVVASLDSLASTASGYLQAGVPGPFHPMVQPEALKALLSKELRFDNLVPAMDTSRPAVVGLADPIAYHRGALGGLVVALPLKDGRAFIAALERMALRH